MKNFLRAQGTILSHFGAPGKSYGYYIPHHFAHLIDGDVRGEPYRWLEQRWQEQIEDFSNLIEEARRYNSRFRDFAVESPDDINQPRFNQYWFSGLDGVVAYTLVRKFQPGSIIEVGSGHSTRFLRQAITDAKLRTVLHSIDPQPRRDIDAICSHITRRTVEKVPLETFNSLGPGDILFIDGSHVAMPGTDVDYLFNRVLPTLKEGVLVHIHDILLPYGYPQTWANRSYNEQLLVLGLLGGGKRYRTLMPNAFVRRNMAADLETLFCPLSAEALETSLWVQVAEDI